jgi:two-component system cell cycle sensor histidine kinase/response regulator CckA
MRTGPAGRRRPGIDRGVAGNGGDVEHGGGSGSAREEAARRAARVAALEAELRALLREADGASAPGTRPPALADLAPGSLTALEQDAAKFRTLFEMVGDAIFLMTDQVFLDCNARTLAIFGCERHEIIGRSPVEFSPERQPDGRLSADKAREKIAQALGGTPQLFEWQHTRLDGTLFDAEVSLSRVTLDGVPRLLAIVRDVTDRRRVEQALRLSEARLRTVLANLPIIVFTLDPAGIFTLSEGRGLDALGLQPGEVVGRSAFELYRDHPQVCESLTRALAGEAHAAVLPVGPLLFQVAYNPIVDDKGRVTSVIGAAMDITDRQKAEAARLEMERRLLHAQKLESIGLLAGGIAHDFNNLLLAVLGNLELALDDLPVGSPVRTSVEHALAAARRGSDLTRQMLAYSGRGHFVIDDIDLNRLVEENAHMLRAATARQVTLDLRLDPAVPPVRADAGQVQQVIMNLITNASEAIGDAPGVVTVSTGAMYCDAEYLDRSRLAERPPPGLFAWVEVSDTGCGMDAETMARLFDPFFSTKFAGRGLGMSAVQGIVQGHGGAILVTSEPGRGTTIRVLFPASAAGPRPSAVGTETLPPGQAAGQSDTGALVLVVDDEEPVRRLTAAMVARLGYRVLAASSGAEAAALMRERGREVACVLLDLTMPDMDGVATFEVIRRVAPAAKVVLCSGYSTPPIVPDLTSRGLAVFLQKPYGLAALRDTLEKVLR